MEPARPLREIFADLAGHDDADGSPAGSTGLAGHEGLGDDLLIRAIGSYADTAPAEVAEHLSAFVAEPSDADAGLHLLAAAPVGDWEGEVVLDGEAQTQVAEPHDLDPHGIDPHFADLGGLGGLENADALDTIGRPAPANDHDVSHPDPDSTGDHNAAGHHSTVRDAGHPGFGTSAEASHDAATLADADHDGPDEHADPGEVHTGLEEATGAGEHTGLEEHPSAEHDLGHDQDHHFDDHFDQGEDGADAAHDGGHEDLGGLEHF